MSSVHTVETDALEYNNGLFDRVLADVPCTGSGTLTKKPDIKWKKDLFTLREMNDLQYRLLCKASGLVKPGGVVVYSTCSIEPEENKNIIEKFLSNNPDFQLESAKGKFPDEILDENGCIQTFPQRHKMDGAFAAKLIKKI